MNTLRHLLAGLVLPIGLSTFLFPVLGEELSLEFHDKIQLSYGDYPEEVFIPWKDEDKESVRKVFLQARDLAPGVMKRVTMYRPLRFYRCRKSRRNIAGLALGKVNGIYLYDSLFEAGSDSLLRTLIHECAHLVDLMETHETGEEWNELVLHRMKRVRNQVTAQGGKYFQRGLDQSDQTEGMDRFRTLPRDSGLPSLYACRNTAEALADCVEATVSGRYQPPGEIQRYLETHFLSVPDVLDPHLEKFHLAMEALVQKRDDQALALLTQLIDSRSDLAHLAYHRAELLQKKKLYDQAAADLETAGSSIQEGERVRYNLSIRRGNLLASRNQPEGALTEYTTAILQFPYATYAYRQRAKVHASRKDYEEAINDISRAISFTPDDEYLFRTRALYQFNREQYPEALADMDIVLKRREGKYEGFDFKYIWERSMIKMKLEDYEGALEDIALYNEHSPFKFPTFEVIQTRVEAYMATRQYELALKDYDWLRQFNSNDPKLYQQRLACLRQMGRLEQAIEEWTQIIAGNADRLDAYLMRAPLLKELGRPEEAVRDYDAVFEKSSDKPPLLQSIGWALATSETRLERDGQQALRFARQADELTEGNYPICAATIAAAYAQLGNFTEAVLWQQKALEMPDSDEKTRTLFQEQLRKYQNGETL